MMRDCCLVLFFFAEKIKLKETKVPRESHVLIKMVYKSLRMNASASSEMPATPREFKPRVKSLESLDAAVEDPTPKKYIHVHHFKNTKLFGAWFNDPSKPGKKVRLFFGSHLTAYLAARAQDRAALKYKPYALDPRSIKLNFKEEDYDADKDLREMLTCEEFGELLRKESRPKYTKMEPTACLRKFLARERARGNIPSAVSPKEENIISLDQYLKEVIRKRAQPDDHMKDPVPTDEESSDEESSEYQESSDEEMEDPVPTAKQKKNKHDLKLGQKKRTEGKRMVVYTAPRTERSPVAGPPEKKPSDNAPAPLIWGQTRPRTKRYEGLEYSKLQSKLHKIDFTNVKKSREPAPPTKSEGLPSEVNNITKSPQGAPMEPESLQPTVVEKTKSREPGNEGLPQSPDGLKFTIKWHYKMHMKQQSQTPRTSAEIVPAKFEDTKSIPDQSGTEDPPQSPEFSKVQFRSKWHYKLHEIQKLQTTSSLSTNEPSPENAEAGSYLQELAKTMLTQAAKLV